MNDDPSQSRLSPSHDPARASAPGGSLRAYALSPRETLELLETREAGLDEPEVARRRARYGENILPRPEPPGVLALYLRQFRNPLVYLLLAATVVSVGLEQWADAAFIFVVLQFNAVIGSFQEWKAETSAEALSRLIRNIVTVVREGRPRNVDAAELVPGDLVRLESGILAPADMRILSARELQADESLLTGESTPVSKTAETVLPATTPLADRNNMIFAGSTVLSGRVTAVVTRTGGSTEIGRIAESLARGEGEPPPLIRRLERMSRTLGIAVVMVIAALAVVQVLQDVPLADVFLVSVALAVAAIPEGLPVAITVALSIATGRMAARNVIVRALPAVEGLGACTVIASDKTGTLTLNELTIRRIALWDDRDGHAASFDVSGEGYDPAGEVHAAGGQSNHGAWRDRLRELAESGVLCNEATLRVEPDGAVTHLGDTVDVAFLVLGRKAGLDEATVARAHPRQTAIPYEPQRRFAAVFSCPPGEGQGDLHVKGAAEVVVPMCVGIDQEAALEAADDLAAEGYRVLAVACGRSDAFDPAHAPAGLRLLGFVGLIDPVRPEVPAAIETCRRAGVDVRMVTGDHPRTALAIARELGLAEAADQVVTGAQLSGLAHGGLEERVRGAKVFARVEPVQKLTIVKALQANGEMVAVSGDGVNDAPALSSADIGVAMGRQGTDVARGAADLILTDDNFASIVAGIEEGRIAYDNLRKLVFLLVSTGLAEIVLFILAIGAGLPPPLFAAQLLWLNLVTNGIQHVALAFERGEPGALDRPPRPPKEHVFEQRMLTSIGVSGAYIGAAGFAFYAWALDAGLGESAARNLLLMLMVLFENFQALNARSERRSIFAVPLSANWFLVIAVIGAQGLHILSPYIPGLNEVLGVSPIALSDWLGLLLVGASLVLVMEVFKAVTRRRAAPDS